MRNFAMAPSRAADFRATKKTRGGTKSSTHRWKATLDPQDIFNPGKIVPAAAGAGAAHRLRALDQAMHEVFAARLAVVELHITEQWKLRSPTWPTIGEVSFSRFRSASDPQSRSVGRSG
jgi:hypothetical protein